MPYDEALDPDEVREQLERHGDFELVALVHSETPSGIHNPVGEIAPLVRDAGALVFVDVVSALGCAELRVDEWGIDLGVGGPQKCLAGPPGMSLCVDLEDAWEAIERNPNAPRGSFLSLLDWRETWMEGTAQVPVYAVGGGRERGPRGSPSARRGPRHVIARHPTAARACARAWWRWGWSCGRAARPTRRAALRRCGAGGHRGAADPGTHPQASG